jgi:hypothetical protein
MVTVFVGLRRHYPSSLLPVATMRKASSGAARWNAKTVSGEPATQASRLASSGKSTGMAIGWTGATTVLGSVVRQKEVDRFRN